QGQLAGEVAFADHGGNVYRIMGYSDPSGWRRYQSAVGETISSFRRLTDRQALDVQPMRLQIVRLPSAMSLRSFYERSPAPIDVEELAALNRVDPGEVIPAGTRIKTVTGTRLPD